MENDDSLTEAIGRVAVAASHADLTVRNMIGLLGGGGAQLIAEEQPNLSKLIEWSRTFAVKLFTAAAEDAAAFDRAAIHLKKLLEDRNTVIHGLWFSEGEGEPQQVAMRRGKRGYEHSEFSVEDIRNLASDLYDASAAYLLHGNRIVFAKVTLNDYQSKG